MQRTAASRPPLILGTTAPGPRARCTVTGCSRGRIATAADPTASIPGAEGEGGDAD